MRLPLWPGDRFELVTSLSVSEIERRLLATVSRVWNVGGSQVGNGHFKLVPRFFMSKLNPFEPVVKGTMRRNGPDTLLVVRQELPAYVGTFWRIWMSLALLFNVSWLLALLTGSVERASDTPSWTSGTFPMFMPVFGYLLAGVGFWAAARHTKDDLSITLSATER
ncbi:MAG: hypothetical protein AAF830_08280 [Pseudomonadota bacterium]